MQGSGYDAVRGPRWDLYSLVELVCVHHGHMQLHSRPQVRVFQKLAEEAIWYLKMVLIAL